MPIGEYLVVVARRWWVVLLVAVIASGAALATSRAQTPVYRSTARLMVTPGRTDFGVDQATRNQLRPMAQRVKTTEIARQVDREEQFDLGAERLLQSIRTEAVLDQNLVQIDADDTDPLRAERVAGAFAQVFAQQHAAADVGKPLGERFVVDVLDRPSPAVQIAPQTRVQVLAAALIGLLAGVLLAFGLEYADNTLKSAQDVERVLGIGTLAVIPRHVDRAPASVAPELHASEVRGGQRVS